MDNDNVPLHDTEAPHWTFGHSNAANREGWDIWLCDGSDNGPYQVQKIDCPDDDETPTLETDLSAWRIMRHGTEPHHIAARNFIHAHNLIEWAAIDRAAGYLGI